MPNHKRRLKLSAISEASNYTYLYAHSARKFVKFTTQLQRQQQQQQISCSKWPFFFTLLHCILFASLTANHYYFCSFIFFSCVVCLLVVWTLHFLVKISIKNSKIQAMFVLHLNIFYAVFSAISKAGWFEQAKAKLNYVVSMRIEFFCDTIIT